MNADLKKLLVVLLFAVSTQAADHSSSAAKWLAAPFVRSLTHVLPSLRALNGLNHTAGGLVPGNHQLNSAIEQFASPLIRFALGGQPVASDIQQLLRSIPEFVLNVPGLGAVDVKKLDPAVVKYVLRGGVIPGVPKETTDSILRSYMLKMVQAADAANRGMITDEQKKMLPPIEMLPTEMVSQVMSGENLPTLNEEQTHIIKEYYSRNGSPAPVEGNPAPAFPVIDIMNLLPPNYNISKIPMEVIETLFRGEIPDLKRLPQDLQDYLKANANKLIEAFAKNNALVKNATVDDLLKKLPVFERPKLDTVDAYDLRGINHELHYAEAEEQKASRIRFWMGIVLGVLLILSLIVLSLLYWHMKNRVPNHTSLHPGSPAALHPEPKDKKDPFLSSTKMPPPQLDITN